MGDTSKVFKKIGELCRAMVSRTGAEAPYRYVVATVLVFGATIFRLALLPSLGMRFTFVTFFPAVMLAALYGGMRPGLLATVLSGLLADYYWMDPPGFGISGSGQWLGLAIFTISCAMISWITESMHRAVARAGAAEVEARSAAEFAQAAEVLRKERDFTGAVLDTAGVLIIVLDADGRIARFNHACEEASGYAPAEVLGRVFWDVFVPSEELEGVRQTWESLHAGNYPNAYENHWVAKDGSRRLVSWSNTAMARPGGGVEYIIATGVDITRRRRTEEQLARSLMETQQRAGETEAVLAAMNDAVLVYDTGMNVVRANPGFVPTYGFDPVGMNVRDIIARTRCRLPDDGPLSLDQQPTPRALRGEPALNKQFRITRLDGQDRALETSAMPLHVGGKIVGTVTVWHDITERRRAEDALHKTTDRLRLLSDVTSRLLSSDDPQAVVEDLCREVMRHLNCECFFNFLADESSGRLRLNACAGIPEEEVLKIKWLDYGVAVCGCVARQGERIAVEDIQHTDDPRTDLVRSYGIQAYTCHPLMAGARAIGTLSFGSKTRTAFTPDETELMRIVSDKVAIAMQRVLAQQVLEESEGRFRAAFDNGAIPMALTALDRTLMKVNRSFCQLIGYSESELVGHSFAEFTHPDDLSENDVGVQRLCDGGESSFRMEKRYVRKDGAIIWADMSTAAVRDVRGNPLYIVTHIIDITESRRLKTELADRAGELQAIFDSAPVAIWIAHDPQCRLITGNAAADQILQAPRGVNISRSATPGEAAVAYLTYRDGVELKPEELPAQVAAATGRAVPATDAELAFSDGRRVQLLMASVPLFDINGNVRGSITTGADVTGLKLAQQALHTTTQRFHATLSSLYGAIVLLSNEGRVEFANLSFCDEFGLKIPPADLVGLTSEELIERIRAGYEHPEQAIARINEIVESGLPVKGEEVALSDGRTCLRDFIPLLLKGAPHGRVWHHIDITRRKWMEKALRDSEQRHRLLHETMLQGVVHQNADGVIIAMNPAAERILGKSLTEYLGGTSADLEQDTIREDGKPFPGLEHPAMVSLRTGREVRDVVMGVFNPRQMAYRWMNVSSVPLFRPGEDSPYEVYTLFDDITERRQAEDAVVRHNTIQAGINRILEAVLTCETEETLGTACLSVAEDVTQSKFGFIGEIKEDELKDIAISNPGWDACVLLDDKGHHVSLGNFKIHGIYGRVLVDGESLFTNDPPSHPDSIGIPAGHPPLESFLGVPLTDETGTIGMIAVANRVGGYGHDQQEALESLVPAIVEAFLRKRAEAALRESEERLRLVLQASMMGTFEVDLLSGAGRWNDVEFELLGLNPGDVADGPESFFRFVHPDDLGRLRADWENALRSGTLDSEFRIVRADGEVRWLAGKGQFTFEEGAVSESDERRALRFMGVNFDITARKQAEDALRESEERFRAIASSTPDHILVQDRDLRYLFVTNPQLDLTEQDMIGKTDYDFLSGEDADRLMGIKRKAMETATPLHVESPIISAEGEEQFFDGTFVPKFDGEGRVDGLIGYFKNVTEQKRMDRVLRENEERLSLALAVSKMGTWELDLINDDAWRSLRHDQIFGYETLLPEWTYGMFLDHVLPEDRPEVDRDFRAAQAEHRDWEFTCRIRRTDGETRWIWARGRCQYTPEGIPARMLGLVQDVTEEKTAEEEMKRLFDAVNLERERLSTLISSISDEVWFSDTQGKFILANPSALKHFGLAAADAIDVEKFAASLEVYRPDGSPRPAGESPALRALRGEKLINQEEMIRIPSSGELRYRQVSSSPVMDAGGGIIGSVSVVRDVTEDRKAQQALRESEERFRMMADAMPQLAWTAHADGFIFWYNRRWYEYTGTTPAQMEGWGWQSVHDPEALPKVLERWKTSIAMGELFEMEFPLRGADGRFRLFLTRGIPMKDSEGRVIRWFGTNTDIAERSEFERQIQASLREKEVMLREIHHRVKNNLQVISSLVNLQADGLDNPAFRGLFQDVRDRVRSMALVHEKLYQSESLAQVDFAEYARSLLNYLWRAHGSPTASIQLALDLEPVSLSVESAVPCGLILNELVTNALKHAFHDRSDGEITTTLHLDTDGHVRLSIRDNGTGLPPGLDWRQSKSLGLRLVQMLAGQLNGTVEVNNENGTEFVIAFLRSEP